MQLIYKKNHPYAFSAHTHTNLYVCYAHGVLWYNHWHCDMHSIHGTPIGARSASIYEFLASGQRYIRVFHHIAARVHFINTDRWAAIQHNVQFTCQNIILPNISSVYLYIVFILYCAMGCVLRRVYFLRAYSPPP